MIDPKCLLTLKAVTLLAFSAVLGGAAQPSSTGEQAIRVQDCAHCPALISVPAPPGGTPFLVGIYEVTWKEYLQSYLDGSCPFPNVFFRSRSISDAEAARVLQIDWPVTGVEIKNIECYLDWLGKKGGRVYRLPTSVEWEWLARGGIKARFPWGNDWQKDVAAIPGQFSRRLAEKPPITPSKYVQHYMVGQFESNGFGLYDTFGNAIELTSSCRPAEAPPQRARGTCGSFIVKGVHWPPDRAAIDRDNYINAQSDMRGVGFRVISETRKANNV